VNRDPIEEDGGLNVHSFVGNSPISQIDVLGLIGLTPPIPIIVVPPPTQTQPVVPPDDGEKEECKECRITITIKDNGSKQRVLEAKRDIKYEGCW